MPKNKKGKVRSVLPVLRIFCEGEKTEPYYLKGYVDHFHSGKRNIIIIENTNKNTPVQLVDVAVEAKRNGCSGDWVWVVFDRESSSVYPDKFHAEARNKANDNGVNIALSNVCFEFWILLHFVYTEAAYTSCSDLLNNSKLKEYLKAIGVESYDKGLPTLFDKLKDNVEDAIARAKKLKTSVECCADKDRCAPHQLNPYVDIHELLLDMKNFIDDVVSVRG
jgi:hypothetical protein